MSDLDGADKLPPPLSSPPRPPPPPRLLSHFEFFMTKSSAFVTCSPRKHHITPIQHTLTHSLAFAFPRRAMLLCLSVWLLICASPARFCFGASGMSEFFTRKKKKKKKKSRLSTALSAQTLPCRAALYKMHFSISTKRPSRRGRI